MIYVK